MKCNETKIHTFVTRHMLHSLPSLLFSFPLSNVETCMAEDVEMASDPTDSLLLQALEKLFSLVLYFGISIRQRKSTAMSDEIYKINSIAISFLLFSLIFY
jgi:hypothetical protein